MSRHASLLFFSLTILSLIGLTHSRAEIIYIKDVGLVGAHGPYPLGEVQNSLFLGGSDRGVDIYDISDLKQRTLLSSIPTLGKLQHFTLYNYIVALADSSQGILVYDISNPSAPMLLSQIPDQRNCLKLIIHNNILFAGSPQEMALYSLNDLTLPVELKNFTLITPELPHFKMEDFLVDDEHLYTGGSKDTPGTVIYDIRDLEHIEMVYGDHQEKAGMEKRNFQFQSILYKGQSRFNPFNMRNFYITNPPAIEYYPSDNPSVPIYKLKYGLKHMLIQSDNDLLGYNMIQGYTLITNGSHPSVDSFVAVEASRNRVFIAGKNQSRNYLLVQTPGPSRASMVTLDSVNLTGAVLDLESGDSLLVALMTDSVMIFSTTNDLLTLINGWKIPAGSATQIALSNEHLYVAGIGGLKHYDLRQVTSGTPPSGVTLTGNHVPSVYADNFFLAYQELSGSNQFRLFQKIGRTYSAVPSANYSISDTISSIAMTPKTAFIAMGHRGIRSLNIATPGQITVIDTLSTTAEKPYTKVTCQDDILCILAGRGGFLAYYESDVNFTMELAHYNRGSSTFFDIAQDFNFFYTGIDSFGLQILRITSTNYSDQRNSFSLNRPNTDSVRNFTIDNDRLYVFSLTDSILAYTLNSVSPYITNIPASFDKGGKDWGPFQKVLSYDTLSFTYSYTMFHHAKFNAFSIKDSVRGKFLSTLSFGDSLSSAAACQNRYIYLGVGNEIKIYDYLNPSLPLYIPGITLDASVKNLAVYGTRLFAVAGTKIYMYDLANPQAPTELHSMTLTIQPLKMVVLESVIYAMDGNGYLCQISLAGNNFVSESVILASRIWDFAADQDYIYYQTQSDLNLYAQARQGGLTVSMLSNLDRPINLEAYANQLVVVMKEELGHDIYRRVGSVLELIYSSDAYNVNRVAAFNPDRNKLLISEVNALRILQVDMNNHAPRFIRSLPDTTIMATITLQSVLTAEDSDGDILSFSLVSTGIANAAVIGNAFNFTPSALQVGIYNFIIQVSDGRNGVTYDTARVEVKPYQEPPQAFSLIAPAANQSVSGTGLDFRWHSSLNAGKYDFYCGTDTNLISPITNLSDTSYHLSAFVFPENGSVYWKVVAKLNDGTSHKMNTGGYQRFYYSNIKEAPLAPVIVYPANRCRVEQIRPVLAFLKSAPVDPQDTSIHYYVEVSGSASFNGLLYKDSLIHPACNLDTLKVMSRTDFYEGYSYYWRVQATDGEGHASPWDADSFYVDALNDPPAPFALVAPAHQTRIISDSVRLVWRTATDLNHDSVFYQLLIDTLPSFVNTLVDTITSDTSYILKGNRFRDNTVYYWRIKATDKIGASRYGDPTTNYFWRDMANNPPSSAVPYSPVSNATVDTVHPTLIIHNSTDPDPFDVIQYRFIIYQDHLATVVIETSPFLSGGLSGKTSYTITSNLSNQSTYYWKVEAYDGEATITTGVPFWFNVSVSNRVPQVPHLLKPTHQSVTQTGLITFVWSKCTDADLDPVHYRLRIGYNTGLSLPLANDTVVSDTSCSLQIPFVDNLDYWWNVWASDTKDSVGASEIYKFTCRIDQVAPTTPVPFQPTLFQMVTESRPTFTVTNSTDANPGDQIRYYFEIDTTFTFNSDPQVKISSGYVPQGSAGKTSFIPTVPLLDNHSYFWRCRAYDQLDNSSAFSSNILFYVNHTPENPTAFQLWYPVAGQIFIPTDTFLWQSSSDPDLQDSVHYVFSIYRDSLRSALIHQITTQQATSVRFDYSTVLQDDSIYFWQIRAVDKTNLITYSEIRRLIYSIDGQTGLKPFALIYPPDPAFNVELNPTFKWNRSGNLKSPASVILYYFERIDLTVIPSSKFSQFPVMDTMLAMPEALQYGHTYTWRVGAIDPVAMSDTTWSEMSIFTTLSQPAGGLIGFDYYIQNGQWVFSWADNPVIPFQQVRVYSDNGTGTIDYSTPLRQVTVPVYTTAVPFWETGQTRLFAIQSYNSAGDPGLGSPILLKLVPDSMVPQIIYPSPAAVLKGDNVSFYLRSPLRSPATGQFAILLKYQDPMPPANLIPMINLMPYNGMISVLSAFAPLFNQGQFWMLGRNTQNKLDNAILYRYDDTTPQIWQTADQVQMQKTTLTLSRAEDGRFATAPTSLSDYCYLIQTPPAWLDGITVTTDFATISQTVGLNLGLNQALLITCSSWSGFTDSLRVSISMNQWLSIPNTGVEPPFQFAFKKTGTVYYENTMTTYDPVGRCLSCKIADNGELIVIKFSDIDVPDTQDKLSSLRISAYPNPFNQRVTLNYTVAEQSHTLKVYTIYNIDGQLIWETATVNNRVVWDGKKQNTDQRVASGLYFYQVRAGNRIMKGKMILLK